MRKVSHGMNETILAGLPDKNLEAAATTLDAMKRNLLTFLQSTPE